MTNKNRRDYQKRAYSARIWQKLHCRPARLECENTRLQSRGMKNAVLFDRRRRLADSGVNRLLLDRAQIVRSHERYFAANERQY